MMGKQNGNFLEKFFTLPSVMHPNRYHEVTILTECLMTNDFASG